MALFRVVTITALSMVLAFSANAQTPLQCADSVAQDPTLVYRSGLWKQWIYWSIPGRTAYAAIQRIVTKINESRSSAGLPLLISNPSYEIVVSVFDERNARGANGSSTLPTTSNQEAFLATFVDDDAGGSEVLFLADPLRSNNLLTAKGVAGVSAIVEREIELGYENGEDKVSTEWKLNSVEGDSISFSAHYPSTAVYYHSVGPAARVNYANCNLTHSSDLIYRSAPTKTYPLFAREEGNFVDISNSKVKVKVQVKYKDPDVNAIFNDAENIPEVLIGTDRDVRIEKR